jgi:general secretion pathway protein B
MSLILDALRKSEHERQREAGPALSVIPESRPARGMPKWVPALVALLALNIVVLGVVLLRDRPAAPDTAPAAATAAPAAAPGSVDPGAAASRRDVAPLDLPSRSARQEVRPLTTELPTTPPPARPPAAAAQSGQAPSPGTVETSGSGAASQQAPPAGTTRAARAEDAARLPRFADLVVRGQLNVPHMHLDIHVYSDDPEQRFVFINMRRYNEGQAAQEGPRIERIVPGGVVMDYQGQRFLLTRD